MARVREGRDPSSGPAGCSGLLEGQPQLPSPVLWNQVLPRMLAMLMFNGQFYGADMDKRRAHMAWV